MKKLAISLLVVGAVFGNLAYSADSQIEQLKIELEKRVKILDHEKHLFALSTELVSETDKVSPITRHGILYWQSEARESVKRTEVIIESIERKILNLVDLKSKEGGVFGSTVHCMRDNVLNMQSEARKIAKTVKPANTDKPPIVKSETFERKIEKLTDLKSEEDGVFGSAVCSVDRLR